MKDIKPGTKIIVNPMIDYMGKYRKGTLYVIEVGGA